MAPKSAPSLLAGKLSRLKPTVLRVWLATSIAGLLALSPTIYMMEVYGRVVTSRSELTLLLLTVMVLGAYVVMEVLSWIAAGLMHEASRDFDNDLGGQVLAKVFSASLDGSASGGQQALSDLRTIREFLYSPAFLATLEAPISLIFLMIMFGISPVLGYFSIFGALIQLVIVVLTERKVQPALSEANIAAIAAQNFAVNSQRNAEVIEAMGMLEGVHARWMGLQKRFLFMQARASDNAGALTTAAKSVLLIQASAGLGLGFWLMTQGHIAHGGLAILGGVVGAKVLQPLTQVVSQWRQVVDARDAYARLDGLLGTLAPSAPALELPPPQGNLSVEAVTAGAPGSSLPIIHGINFAIPAGQCLGIVGPSASGKTTLLRVLLGIWPTLNGKVRLDNADIHAWPKSELGAYLGYLPQDVELFEGTLAENIGRFNSFDELRLSDAISLAGLGELVASLPRGLNTQIGAEGAYLSGGQRQRVGIARAVYGNPSLIVLDEPNSSLDQEGEAALLALLGELKKRGATVIVVTHRTNILPAVDHLLLLRDGRAHAFGKRDEVLAVLQGTAQTPAAGAAS